jgi:archaellum biogenesis ATPase FlaH
VAAKEAPRADDKPASFNTEQQEELLAYLLAKESLDRVMADGFSPELFDPNIFDTSYSPYMDGIIRSWECNESVTITQISINSAKSSPKDYEVLNRISERPVITPKQVEERLNLLSHNKSHSELTALINEASQSNKPLHEKADALRTGLDTILGGSSILLPQSHHLHQVLDDIRNPKHQPIPTGIKSFDQLLGGGFKKGELGMLAGGAGSGKTAFALQLADSVAASGAIAIYISVEIGVSKLTERSLKRLGYQPNAKSSVSDPNFAVTQYEKIANNIYIEKGHHGMQVSEIRAMVLSVMRQRQTSNVLLIIDPFQRLGTGNEKIDYTNETIKIGTLCSQIKEMAESLNIPILAKCIAPHPTIKIVEGKLNASPII